MRKFLNKKMARGFLKTGKIFKKFVIFSVVLMTLLSGSFSQPQNVKAAVAVNTFVQTDWSGSATTTAAVHPTNITGWTNFSTSTDLNLSTALTLATSTSSTAQTTDTHFNAGALSSVDVSGTGTGSSVILDSQGADLGSGADGAVTISTAKNINTDIIASGRTCADGIAYNVTALTSNTATLSATPAAGCLNSGDKVMLINLQGDGTDVANVGNYEFLTLNGNVTTATATFNSNKTKYYGDGVSDDTNLGTATNNQRVILQRIPQYTNVTSQSGGSLTASSWDGQKGGVVAFYASGAVDVQSGGSITVNAIGYRGSASSINGESYNKWTGSSSLSPNLGGGGARSDCPYECYIEGGGGGYGIAGNNGGSAQGGLSYGSQDLSKLFFGSSGGNAGSGSGGGIIYVQANSVLVNGGITGNGANGQADSGAGAGAGGSIYLAGNSLSVGNNLVTVSGGSSGGINSGAGGKGRIHLKSNSITGTIDSIPQDILTPDFSAMVGDFSDVAAPDSNNIFISYFDSTNFDLKFAKSTNGGISWAASTVDSANSVGQYTSIAAPDTNNIFISYYDNTNGDLKVAKSTNGGTSWASLTLDSVGNVGLYTSIIAPDSNNVFISYQDGGNTDLKFAKSINAGMSWTTSTVDSIGSVGQYTSIAAPDTNNIFISYYDNNSYDLNFAKSTNSGTSWATSTVDSGEVNPAFHGIDAVDSNNVFISYRLNNNDLKFAKTINSGTSWTFSTIDNISGGQGSAIAAVDANNIFIAYPPSSSSFIKFAKSTNGGGAWATSTVPTHGNVAYSGISIAAPDIHNVFVSHYDTSNTDLKLARPSNGTSAVSTIYASSGTFTSGVMDLGSARNLSTLGYSVSTPAGTSLTVDARAGNTASPDGTWTSWQTGISNGGSLAALNGNRYVQYRANLSGDTTATPSFNDITFNYITYAASGTLTSSVYNSDAKAAPMGISWTENLPAGTDVKFQLRTSSNNSTWTSWLGPNGTSGTYFTTSTGGETIPWILRDTGTGSAQDQYFQYQATLTGDGSGTPTLSDVSINYEILPSPATGNLSQYKSDGTTAISTSTLYTNETSVVLKVANVSGLSDATTIKARFEVKAVGSSFNGSGTVDGTAVADGGTSVATISGLSNGTSYKWRAWLVDDLGRTRWPYSPMADFNFGSAAFTVDTTGPSVGSFTINAILAPQSGLVGYWPFDTADISGNTTYDRSGQNNNGTLYNSPSLVAGKTGQAISFLPASNKYVQIPDSASLSPTSQVSVSFWMYPTDFPSYYGWGGFLTLKGNGCCVNTQSYGAGWSPPNGTLWARWGDNSTIYGTATPANAVLANEWSLFTMVHDGATNWVYINGTPVASTTYPISILDTTDPLIIGGELAGSFYTPFPGYIDEYRVYNRALSASEVQDIYLASPYSAYATSTAATLSLASSDAGAGMYQMRFSNDNATWSSWESYATSKAWTLSSGDGLKTVYVQFTDNAGNSSATTTTITLDTASPTFSSLSINSGANYTSSTSATLSLSASDAGSGLYQMRFSNDNATWSDWEAYATSKAWTLESGDGEKTVYAEIKDNAGRISASSDMISIDSTGPVADSFSINSGATIASSTSATLSISVSDADSGWNQMRFSNDNATWSDWEASSTSKAWTLSAGDGEKTVYAQFSDNAGNTTSTTDTITLDATGPAVSTFNANSGAGYATSTSVSLSISASDALSGMNQMRFSNDNAAWSSWESYATSKSWTLSDGDGSKTIYANFSDLAGNTSATTTTITLDTQNPTITSISINNGASYTSSTSATLSISASDAGSGLSQMRFSNDNATWSDWEAYATSKSWTLESGDGAKTVYLEIKDNAGGVSAANDTISIDSAGPVGSTIDYLNAYTTSTSATVTLNEGADAVSGISYSILQRAEANIVDGVVGGFGSFAFLATTTASSSYSDATIATDKAYKYQLIVSDNAGNTTTASSTNILKVDNTGPSGGSVSYTNGLFDTEPVTITVTSAGGTDSAGVASRSLQRASATLSQGVPGAWSGWSEVAAEVGTYNDTNTVNKTAYKYRLMETDNAGNISYTYCTVSTSTECVASVAFNTRPEANILTASQSSSSLVNISYEVRDTDSVSGTVTVGLEYYNGASWVAASSSSLTGDTGVKNVNTGSPNTYTSYNLSWNAKADFSNQYFAPAGAFMVRVKADDLEAAKNIGYGTSTAILLDTKDPTVTATINAAQNQVVITASDDTNISYKVSSQATSTDVWTDVGAVSVSASSTSWIFDASSTNPDATVSVRDSYGNSRNVAIVAPQSPQNVQWNDLSNPVAGSYREFVGWNVYSPSAGAAFANYKLYKSTDDANYNLLTQIADVNLNYYLDTAVSASQTYYYKATVTDSDGDISFYSSKVSDLANGQGGSDLAAPVISNVTSTAETSWARITWTTDEVADSKVEYATDGSYNSSSTNSALVASHSITLTGLEPGTYQFRVKSKDSNGNETTSSGHSFTITPGPVISAVTAINIGDTSATISWNTNVDSNSFVYYSPNADMSGATEIGIGNMVGADSATSTTYQHRVDIGGLLPSTWYYYYVRSTDNLQRVATDSNGGGYYSFRTSLDNKAPSITAISTPVLSSQAAVVVWRTDEPANSMVSYGRTSGNLSFDSVLDPTRSAYHVVTLLGLEPLTKYYFQVKSTDEAGNEAVSGEQNFTTPTSLQVIVVAGSSGGDQKDTVAPTISDIKIGETGPFSAKIEFKTSEAAIGFIEYGKTSQYETRAAGSDYLVNHGVTAKGLRMGTEYHYRVKAVDKSGNTAYSEDSTFKTKFFAESMDELRTVENIEQFQEDIEKSIESIAPSILPPFIENPVVSDITENSVAVSWRTNVNSFSLVSYSAEDEYDAAKENPYLHEVSDTVNKVNEHKMTLTGLKPNTKYHLIAKSFRIPDVVGKSSDITFVTKASKVQARIFDVKNNSFKVAWTTDEPASSIVEFKNTANRETSRKIDDAKATYHSMIVDNLQPATRYEVKVFGYNEKGNLIESGETLSAVTSRDVIAPKISGFKVDSALVPGRKDRTQTVVSWLTDEPGTSVVQFSEGTGSGEMQNKVEINDSYVQTHNLIIPNLKAGTIYQIKVISVDLSGNTATFGPRTIITPTQSESIFDVIFKNFEDTFKFMRQVGQ